MHPLPHHYRTEAKAGQEGRVSVFGAGLPTLSTSAPPQFDGPGGDWSPETLLLGAVADCFVLTFRSIARSQSITWISLDCVVDGVLDRDGRTLRFTGIEVFARLVVPGDADQDKVLRALHKAEQQCLISNSLVARRSLAASIEMVSDAAPGGEA